MDQREERLPLPSEDTGDRADEPDTDPPRDGELRALVIEALRASDVPAGDRLRIGVSGGSMVVVQGEVESVDVLNEILGIVGGVPGVTDVLDEVQVAGV